jgi:hypothetical protein
MSGVGEYSFSVVPFFLEHFLVHYNSKETSDQILATLATPVEGTFFFMHPWTRLAQATS